MNLDNLLLVGYITGAFGIRGQLKLKLISDQPDYLAHHIRTLYIAPGGRFAASQPPTPHAVLRLHRHKPELFVLTLKGITSREAAEEMRHSEVYIPEDQARPLEADEYYLHQLYHLRVETTEGEELGQVRDVLETGANDVIIVERTGQSDLLIPMIRDVVQAVDIAEQRIVVRLLEGLL